jgi:hypothetical protein
MAKLSKDSYYFPHFYNARHDRKIKRIRKDLGIEGYGIFFMLLEVLREQTDFKYPFTDIDLLSEEFGTSTAKIEAVIKMYDLFSLDSKLMFFSTNLMVYLEPYLQKSERARKANEIRWGRQKLLQEKNQKDIHLDNKSTLVQNPSKVSKVNILEVSSKVTPEKF